MKKIMIAELLRNVGKFDECVKIVETINEEEFNWIKEILKKECLNNNKKVVVLRQ